MRKILTIIGILLLCPTAGFTQDKKIDKLEIFYDQGYYKKVLRKSRRLQAKPEYDYSSLPDFYEALSLFRLSGDDHWLKRHKKAIDYAITSYEEFMDDAKIDHYINQHYYEIAALKIYLIDLQKHFDVKGWENKAKKLKRFLEENMDQIDEEEVKVDQIVKELNENEENPPEQYTHRDKIVAYAKKYIGVRYKWAGSDESGFDCSGYTSFIYRKFGIILPRTAGGQKEKTKKVKIAQARKGDLVFFGPGAKITHVGLVVSEKGESLTMIHASSSKGVIVTDVEKSKYWSPKLKGAGAVI